MISELRPSDTPEHAEGAWVSCLLWAAGEQEIVNTFYKDTGLRLTAPRNALDRMIDDATKAHERVAEAFVKWFNVNVWGPWV